MNATAALKLPPRTWAVLLVGVTACGGELELGRYEAPIANGTNDSGHAAVAELRAMVPGETLPRVCTGTLIGTQSVLTAAHCVVGVSEVTVRLKGEIQPSSSTVAADYVGRVIETDIHPDHEVRATEVVHDLALLRVWPPAPVTPVLLSDTVPRVGMPTTLVGFGLTASTAQDQGTKRTAPSVVSTVDPARIGFEAAGAGRGGFCLGDSGAPVLAQVGVNQVQIGVHSYLLNPDGDPCAHGARAMRVDAYLPWIRQAAKGDMSVMGAAVQLGGDVAPPSVSITEPADGSVVSTQTVIRAHVVDDVALRSVTLLVDGEQLSSVNSPPYAFRVELLAASHRIAIVAEDAAGNVARAEVSITSVTGNPAQGASNGCAISDGSGGRRPVDGGVSWMLVLLAVGRVMRRRKS